MGHICGPKTYFKMKDKKPIHRLKIKSIPPIIERLISPRFWANYDEKTKELTNVTWIDPEPDQQQQINVLKKAFSLLKHSKHLK